MHVWASDLASLILRIFSYKTGMIIVPISSDCCVDHMRYQLQRAWHLVLTIYEFLLRIRVLHLKTYLTPFYMRYGRQSSLFVKKRVSGTRQSEFKPRMCDFGQVI